MVAENPSLDNMEERDIPKRAKEDSKEGVVSSRGQCSRILVSGPLRLDNASHPGAVKSRAEKACRTPSLATMICLTLSIQELRKI